MVLADNRFEIPVTRHLGLVVFRLKGENLLTEKLLKRINARGHIHCVPAALKENYVIRFTVTAQYTTNEDILKDWKEIRTAANEILEVEEVTQPKAKVSLAGKEFNRIFNKKYDR